MTQSASAITVTPEQLISMLSMLRLSLPGDITVESENIPAFSLEFSGRRSKKAYGEYYPSARQIVIHEKNVGLTDEMIIDIAIHEFAHHIHYCVFPNRPESTGSSHNTIFQAIFHALKRDAEEKGIYRPSYRHGSPETVAAFSELKTRIDSKMVEMAKVAAELGALMEDAAELASTTGVDREDFMSRYLGISTSEYRSLVKIAHLRPQVEDAGFQRLNHLIKVKDLHRALDLYAHGRSQREVMFALNENLQEECQLSRIEYLHELRAKKQLRKEKLEGQLLLIEEESDRIDQDSDHIREDMPAVASSLRLVPGGP